MKGRKSKKKESLLRVYWNLRVSMEVEEIIKVLEFHSGFEDPNDNTLDLDIKRKIVILTQAMDAVMTMGKEEAISFEDYR